MIADLCEPHFANTTLTETRMAVPICEHCRKALGDADVYQCPSCKRCSHVDCVLASAALQQNLRHLCMHCPVDPKLKLQLAEMNRHLVVSGGLYKSVLVDLLKEHQGVSVDKRMTRESIKNEGGRAVDFITCADHDAAVKIQKWLRHKQIVANWNNNVVRAEVNAHKIDSVQQLKSAVADFLTSSFAGLSRMLGGK